MTGDSVDGGVPLPPPTGLLDVEDHADEGVLVGHQAGPLAADEPPSAEALDPANTTSAVLAWEEQLQGAPQQGHGRLRIMKAADLRCLPPPRWLISGVLLMDTLALLWGRGNTYKTFLALDFALSIVNGSPWQGRATKRGNVLYMVGESLSGFNGRIDAWLRVNGGSSEGLYVFPEMPQFLDATQVNDAIELARNVGGFRLAIIDTLARAFVGGDEDRARDMGVFAENVERLRKATGATILVVHHTTKKGGGPRGSSAMPWATHTELSLNRSNASVTLRCPRQKEGREFAPIGLQARVVNLGAGRDSLVLERAAAAAAPAGAPGGLTANELAALTVLVSLFPNGARVTEWQKAAEQSHGLKSSTFYTVRKSLLSHWVAKQGKFYVPTPETLQLLQRNSTGVVGVVP